MKKKPVPKDPVMAPGRPHHLGHHRVSWPHPTKRFLTMGSDADFTARSGLAKVQVIHRPEEQIGLMPSDTHVDELDVQGPLGIGHWSSSPWTAIAHEKAWRRPASLGRE
ncbi:hypothetical protein RFM99_20205 [Mesorhizobium sp. VK4C]|uniref:hypothetical protein n=1 Tax=Mesorhizobium captivum TaxID=3072319 RepID=UPI002A24BAF9|nr:hypothetical protein [Mesorhizobium sp. VK4C]MDX8500730.1 hypothetical protein [Mesorhizobium sp. VK4C]